MVPRSIVRLIALLLVAVAGCGASSPQVQSPTGNAVRIVMEPLKIEVSRGKEGEQRIEAFDAATLFEQAGADLNQQRYAEAAAGYDRLVKDFPDSRFVLASLYNAGLALEGQKDYPGAVSRYRVLVEKHGDTRDALDALFKMGACQAEIGNWAASADTFSEVLKRKNLSTGDYIEAMGRRGVAQYNLKDSVNAERTFREALAWYREHETVERLESDFFLALCQYYMGEITHDQFRAAPVRLPEKQMKQDLEAKARLLIVAQARYVDTARIRNAAWATAAAYQMAMLYRELYDALMGAPIPPQLNEEGKQIYLDELKKTIEPLLRKAIHAHELGIQVAERNSLDNDWVKKSSEQLEQLRALLIPGTGTAPEGAPVPSRAAPGRPENDKLQPPSIPRHDDYHPRVIL
ncbi:MAG: tetratricopeptide repeat protein [Myxococcales bacterium]|nr:tetratricopeptide repeat protein [Myxococcales bacterium]